MKTEKAAHIDDLIGNTPLVDVSVVTQGGAAVYGKFEATNPGGSIKDRIAKEIINDAEEKGLITKGAVIIEPTSGNTGVALAMIAAARGYRFVAVMPETMSVERRKLLVAFGSELVLTPGAEGMKGAIAKAEELLEQTPNSFGPHQFDNPVNAQAHYKTTGPEIWEATGGNIDVLVSGVGSGGTITGAGRYLREQNPDMYIVAVEPAESQVLAGQPSGAHKIQGIGAGFVPSVLDTSVFNEILPIESGRAFEFQKELSTKAGVFVGISSGAAIAAAAQISARPEFFGKTIVAIMPDTGERYLSMLGE